MRNTARSAATCALLFAVSLAAGCIAESTTVQTTPVWSATVPEYGVEYSRTINVFPIFSRNVTAYGDRVEESGSWFLFISWSKTVMRTKPRPAAAEAAPAEVEAVEAGALEGAGEPTVEYMAQEPAAEDSGETAGADEGGP